MTPDEPLSDTQFPNSDHHRQDVVSEQIAGGVPEQASASAQNCAAR
jgi:hypothetical protein